MIPSKILIEKMTLRENTKFSAVVTVTFSNWYKVSYLQHCDIELDVVRSVGSCLGHDHLTAL